MSLKAVFVASILFVFSVGILCPLVVSPVTAQERGVYVEQSVQNERTEQRLSAIENENRLTSRVEWMINILSLLGTLILGVGLITIFKSLQTEKKAEEGVKKIDANVAMSEKNLEIQLSNVRATELKLEETKKKAFETPEGGKSPFTPEQEKVITELVKDSIDYGYASGTVSPKVYGSIPGLSGVGNVASTVYGTSQLPSWLTGIPVEPTLTQTPRAVKKEVGKRKGGA